MGCDIHCYIEYRSGPDDRWHAFGERLYGPRDYCTFGYLAGVRHKPEGHAKPKGIVRDVDTIWTLSDLTLWISDEYPDVDEYCSREQAEKWVTQGSEWWDDDHTRVTHPDWHSHSWMNPREFREALSRSAADTDRWSTLR